MRQKTLGEIAIVLLLNLTIAEPWKVKPPADAAPSCSAPDLTDMLSIF